MYYLCDKYQYIRNGHCHSVLSVSFYILLKNFDIMLKSFDNMWVSFSCSNVSCLLYCVLSLVLLLLYLCCWKHVNLLFVYWWWCIASWFVAYCVIICFVNFHVSPMHDINECVWLRVCLYETISVYVFEFVCMGLSVLECLLECVVHVCCMYCLYQSCYGSHLYLHK